MARLEATSEPRKREALRERSPLYAEGALRRTPGAKRRPFLGAGIRRATTESGDGWARVSAGQRARCLLITRRWIWFVPSNICMICATPNPHLRLIIGSGLYQAKRLPLLVVICHC